MTVLDQMALLRKAILMRHRGPESDSVMESDFMHVRDMYVAGTVFKCLRTDTTGHFTPGLEPFPRGLTPLNRARGVIRPGGDPPIPKNELLTST